MKSGTVILALLVSPLTLAAQNSPKIDPATVVLHGNPIGNDCPIGMHASQGVWDHTIAVRNGLGYQKFSQRISLTLKDAHPARIQAATVRVRGLTGKNHMLQTVTSSNESWDGIRTIKVMFASPSDGAVSADLWIPGFTSVISLELQEVSYGDGSTWRIPDNAVCRIAPDPIMFVTGR